jgi:hypothetical protein
MSVIRRSDEELIFFNDKVIESISYILKSLDLSESVIISSYVHRPKIGRILPKIYLEFKDFIKIDIELFLDNQDFKWFLTEVEPRSGKAINTSEFTISENLKVAEYSIEKITDHIVK